MNIKNIVFIEAGSIEFQLLGKYTMPRIGPALLATILSRSGYNIKTFMENITPVDWEFVKDCDLVCVSALTNTAPRAYEIAKKAREMCIPVVMGGIHPTFMPGEALENADYVIRGEGERGLTALIDTLKSGKPRLDRIDGLSYGKRTEALFIIQWARYWTSTPLTACRTRIFRWCTGGNRPRSTRFPLPEDARLIAVSARLRRCSEDVTGSNQWKG